MTLTKEGKRFILAALLVAMAAFNTGNNLIYLIFAMMLSVLFISVAAPFINLMGLELRVLEEGMVFAGRTASVGFAVKNRKRFSSYSLKLNIGGTGGVTDPGDKAVGAIAHIAPLSEASSAMRVRFEKRGVYGPEEFTVESGFPFIFITKIKKVPVSGGIKVYPALKDIPQMYTLWERGARGPLRPGRGDELFAIRDWRAGDDRKQISWKASAKTGSLMVKESSGEVPGRFNIVLDDIRPLDAAAFEDAVSIAASVAKELIEGGFIVGLVTSKTVIPFGSGPEHLFKVLDHLAVINESDTDRYPEIKGGGLLVLKSQGSGLRGLAADAQMVLYAGDL